ncbi:hypothetical protein [Thalassotalea sp. ND16A]|uniref:hypothetical protein n=1 Tax=Thalassotalea sp. ND16A TaxID=1535422 RepID=UPI00051A709C|nr:hypothetical protein [Thalassotalea sp. ND16A]KGJ97129.1 hypothetical protein ND16A_0051 [Thalassotalea sp. ND16A]
MRELTFNETNQISGALTGCETISITEGSGGGAAIGAAAGGAVGALAGAGLGASFTFGWNIGVYINSMLGQCDAD